MADTRQLEFTTDPNDPRFLYQYAFPRPEQRELSGVSPTGEYTQSADNSRSIFNMGVQQAPPTIPRPNSITDTNGSSMGGSTVQSGNASNPADSFSMMMLDLLKRSKGIDNVELLKRQRALQRASIGKSSDITPEDLRTLSPSQQDAIRSGQVKALEPDIDENAYQLKKAETMTDNFERLYSEATKLGEEFAKNMIAPDSVIDAYVTKIESGAPLATLLSGLNDKTRNAIIAKVDFMKANVASAKPDNPTGITGEWYDAMRLGLIPKDMTLTEFANTRKPTSTTNNVTYNQSKDMAVQASTQKIGSWLRGLSGGDGYTSPDNFKKAKNAWVADGFSAEDFEKTFSNFVNPDHAKDYGVKYING